MLPGVDRDHVLARLHDLDRTVGNLRGGGPGGVGERLFGYLKWAGNGGAGVESADQRCRRGPSGADSSL